MKGYGILCSGEAMPLLKNFGLDAVGAIAENGVRMQQVSRILCDSVPIRKILVPYIDMLNLTDNEKSVFFGDRIIFETTDEQFVQLYKKLTDSEVWIKNGFTLKFVSADNVNELKKLQK